MADKKMFPGVTEQDIQRKQKTAKETEEKSIALEKAKQVAEEKAAQKEERNKLHNLYNKVLPLKVKIGIIAALNFCIGGLVRSVADHQDDGFGDTIEVVPLGHAIAESYIPTYHYEPNWDRRDGETKGKVEFTSDPNPRWMLHMLVLLAEALVLAFVAMNNAKKNKQIDLMAEIAKLSKEQNIDPKYIKEMLKVAPSIVENMSKDSRVYFDMLMEGKFDIDKTPGLLNITTSIMQGHLQTHPEDMEKILSVFDERSIPSQIKAMATTKGRSK